MTDSENVVDSLVQNDLPETFERVRDSTATLGISTYGVNSGIGRSGKVLRRILGLPDNTSVVTDEVIAAAWATNPRTLIAAICDERLHFLQSLKTWPVFGRGWSRRVAEVKSKALEMATDAAKRDVMARN